jgi:hypothetical protein
VDVFYFSIMIFKILPACCFGGSHFFQHKEPPSKLFSVNTFYTIGLAEIIHAGNHPLPNPLPSRERDSLWAYISLKNTEKGGIGGFDK